MTIEQWSRLLGGIEFTTDLNNIKWKRRLNRARFYAHFIQITTIIDSEWFIRSTQF